MKGPKAMPHHRVFAAATGEPAEIIYMSAARLAQLIRAKQVSALEVVEAYIARQLAVNDMLNAVVMNSHARARAEAKSLDAKAAKGEFVGLLHGVPMTLKDSLDTEGVITTGGTYGRQQYTPEHDATVVARLRDAGAILLGKTNTPEFTIGYLGGINYTASNLLYGSSHNPYDLTRSVSGSSGGAAAGVAAGLAAFDIGSDFGGSIRCPAHVNGIAGLKPTAVRVPRTGHIVDHGGVFDLWQQLGPMARRIEDLALITPIISGPDFRDGACAPVPWANPSKVDLMELRVAFCKDNYDTGSNATDDDTKATVLQTVQWLEEVAASVDEDAPTAVLIDLHKARQLLYTGDGWQFYQRLVDRWGTKSISPWVKAAMEKAAPMSSAEMVEAWEKQDLAKSRMLQWMTSYDVFICPAMACPAQPIDQAGGSAGGSCAADSWSYTGVFSSTGWPVVVVRCGSSADGRLPIGVQVIAKPWREDICLAVASYLEERSGGWKPPPI